MTLMRVEIAAGLVRWREVLAAAALSLAGLWLIGLGGYLLVPVGMAMLPLAAGWALVALRRMRFRQLVNAPGVVEIDEGQIGYFGPAFGGFVASAELVEIRLLDIAGLRQWRLRTRDGQVLLIPVAAAGAERLFDAFAALPGADMAALSAALAGPLRPGPLWSAGPVAVPGAPRIAPRHHENS